MVSSKVYRIYNKQWIQNNSHLAYHKVIISINNNINKNKFKVNNKIKNKINRYNSNNNNKTKEKEKWIKYKITI